MNFIREFAEKTKEKNRRFEEMQTEDRLVEKFEKRKMSHDERVLWDKLKDEEKEAIKDANRWVEKVEKLKDKQKLRDSMKFNSEWFDDRSNVMFNQPSILAGESIW